MLKKVPCVTLVFSIFLLLLLFSNVNLASAEDTTGSENCASNRMTETLEILRLGLTPSLRMTSEVGSSSELRMTDGGIPIPYSLIPSPFSTGLNSGQNNSTVESDAQLAAKRVGQRAMYRVYNQWTGEHFYTCSEEERDEIAKVGWTKEDIGWVAPKESSVPVYRLYNKYIPGGDHHYTPDADERDSLVKAGWIYEGIGWYSADEGSLFRAPVYRLYNPYADTGTHHYTLSTSERDNLVKAGWRDEGVGYYGLDQSQMSAVDFNKDIQVTTTSKVYNGKEQTQTITSTNLKENEDFVVEYSNNKNVGTATITITGANGFYGEKVYTFQITQKTISQVRWGDLEFGYDGKAHVPTATAVGLCSGDSATITVTATGNHKDTGTYTATATAISNKNYKLASGLKTDFRIGTKIDYEGENKPTVDTADEIYTGSAITKEVSVAGLTKDKDYTVTYKDNTNVGTATLTIKGIGEYFGEKSYTFKITQKSLTGATITPETLTYNGAEQSAKISKVTLDGRNLKEGTDFKVVSGNKGKDANTYDGLTIEGVGNYKDQENNGSWTISPLNIKDAVVELDNSLTYNGSEQTQSVKSVKVGNLTLTSDDYDLTGNTGTNAETYNTLQISGKGNFTGSATCSFTISPLDIKDATIELDSNSLTYNADTQTKTVTSVKVGELDLSATDYTCSGNSAKDAGDHTITLTGQGNFTGTATTTFSIAKLDISDAEVELGDKLTYSASVQSQNVKSVKVGALVVPVADYVVTNNTQKNAGTYSDENALRVESSATNNITGRSTCEFTIAQLDITGADVTLGEALTYNTKEQTQTVSKVIASGVTLQTSDYAVSNNKQTNAGDSYVLTVAGQGNCKGEVTKGYSIHRADPTYEAPTSLTAVISDLLSSVALPEYDGTTANTKGKWIWDSQYSDSQTVRDTAGNEVFKTKFVPDDTSNYNQPNSIEVTIKVTGFNATFVANAPSGKTVTVNGSEDQARIIWKWDSTEVASHTITSEDFPTATIDDTSYLLAGWTTDQSLTYGPTQKQLSDKSVTADQTYYAVWKPASGYWLGTAKATYLTESDFAANDVNYHSSLEIEADKKVLHDSTAETYDAIKTKWDNYYSGDSVRLYATYEGGEKEYDMYDKKSDYNKFIEFRILEVSGAQGHKNHDGQSDGSAVTFMATHALPTAYQLRSDDSTVGGWQKSDIKSLINSGAIYAKFASDFKGVVEAIKKEYNSGGTASTQSQEPSSEKYQFWIPSYAELVAQGASEYSDNLPLNEGTQYKWASDKNIAAASINQCLILGKTRLGMIENTARYPGSSSNYRSFWWMRSPFVSNDSVFGIVSDAGNPADIDKGGATASKYWSVILCFAF